MRHKPSHRGGLGVYCRRYACGILKRDWEKIPCRGRNIWGKLEKIFIGGCLLIMGVACIVTFIQLIQLGPCTIKNLSAVKTEIECLKEQVECLKEQISELNQWLTYEENYGTCHFYR